MKIILSTLFLLFLIPLYPQKDSLKKVPFEGMDIFWLNGQSRVRNNLLALDDKLSGENIISANLYIDSYFNFNFSQPIDNTQTISSSIGRHNEFQLNLASIGIESNYKNCIGRIFLQAGTMQHLVQETDASVYRGRNSGTGNLKFIREATAGYHFNRWYGINIEAGIFMSYIGLESYMLQDNWSYQRSMPCDFTPFYFQGLRLQIFPNKKIKQELWIMNGWQTYNSFSRSPGFGSSTYWRPNQNLQTVANFYVGRDTQNPDTLGKQSDRIRFHHDNSLEARYYSKPQSKYISQMAFSINNHFGFQNGVTNIDTINAKLHFMMGSSVAHRIWLNKNKMAITLRGDFVSNGGNYLAFSPSPISPNSYSEEFLNDPYKAIQIYQGTITLDLMPNDFITFRLEYGYRKCNMAYFTGTGGTTSPSGWTNGPSTQITWKPDLRKTENRITAAINFRL